MVSWVLLVDNFTCAMCMSSVKIDQSNVSVLSIKKIYSGSRPTLKQGEVKKDNRCSTIGKPMRSFATERVSLDSV